MCDYSKAVVIDNGAYMTKAGFADEKKPSSEFPTIVGKPKLKGYGSGRAFVGHEAVGRQRVLTLNCPVSRGTIWDWDDMETIWQHTFNKELRVDSSERPVLLTEANGCPEANRQMTVEVMFEKFNVPALCVVSQASLSLFATDRKTGVVLESGEDLTQAIAIVDGRIVDYSLSRLELGGQHITKYLVELLNEKNQNFETRAEIDIIRDIKETYCYSALDFDQFMTIPVSSLEKQYEFPDGRVVSLGNERFRCPEVLFKPSMIGIPGSGIHEMVRNTILKCDEDIREELYANIVLGGGTTLFPGLRERLKMELGALVKTTVSVSNSNGGEQSAWIGGAKEAASPSFEDRWITREEYDEFGSSIVSKKFF